VSVAVEKELVNAQDVLRISTGMVTNASLVRMIYFPLLVQLQKMPVEAVVTQDATTALDGISSDVIHAKPVTIELTRNASLVAKANLP